MSESSLEKGRESRSEDSTNALPPQSLRTPPFASPNKPRLLWRGSLYLSDGTELPGLAIVSTIQPFFASSKSSNQNNNIQFQHDSDVKQAPFTLSAEQQDELCLSIEMVRHAPLRIVDVVENGVMKDDSGRLSIQSANQANSISTTINPTNTPNQNIHVTFEAAGNVRLYIDPDQHSTVAFFDRLFAYDFDTDQKERVTGNCSSSALVFSLDKSFKNSMNSTSFDSQFDIFGDHGSTGSAYHLNSTGIMEAVVIGMERNKSTIELHIGRKIVKRLKNPSQSDSQLAPPNANVSSSQSLPLPRPDDPAPRILPLNRTQKMLKPNISLTSLFSRASSFQDHQSTQSKFAIPALPSSIKGQRESSQDRIMLPTEDDIPKSADNQGKERANPITAATKKRGGNHTPGRRGEKRARNIHTNATKSEEQDMNNDPFLSNSEESVEQIEQLFEPSKIKKEESDTTIPPPLSTNSKLSSLPNKQSSSSSIEEKNRSLIKKLVHYQLLGKGVERHESAYASCFGITCQGAMVALRKHVKIQPIDRQIAAGIIEKHLDMYL